MDDIRVVVAASYPLGKFCDYFSNAFSSKTGPWEFRSPDRIIFHLLGYCIYTYCLLLPI